MSLKKRELPDLNLEGSEGGRLYHTRLAHNLAYNVVQGCFSDDMTEPFLHFYERLIELDGGPLVCFLDWSKITKYTTLSRRNITSWNLRFRPHLASTNILTQDSMVTMAVGVASMVLPFLRVHKDRETFEKLMQEARRTHELPPLKPA